MSEIWTMSKNIDWYTPKFIFDALGKPFDLDPCSPSLEKHKTNALNHYILPTDGLIEHWFGEVWLNPPYGRGVIQKWVNKMYEHNNGILLTHVTALPNKWFHDKFDKFTAICFIKGRVNFIAGVGQSAGASINGQMLIAFGQKSKQRLINCQLGKTWVIK